MINSARGCAGVISREDCGDAHHHHPRQVDGRVPKPFSIGDLLCIEAALQHRRAGRKTLCFSSVIGGGDISHRERSCYNWLDVVSNAGGR
jgi:hypothetical protein